MPKSPTKNPEYMPKATVKPQGSEGFGLYDFDPGMNDNKKIPKLKSMGASSSLSFKDLHNHFGSVPRNTQMTLLMSLKKTKRICKNH
jgi:hypothetical protein